MTHICNATKDNFRQFSYSSKSAKDIVTSSYVTEDHLEFSALFIYVLPFQVKFCLNTVEDINAESAVSQFEKLP